MKKKKQVLIFKELFKDVRTGQKTRTFQNWYLKHSEGLKLKLVLTKIEVHERTHTQVFRGLCVIQTCEDTAVMYIQLALPSMSNLNVNTVLLGFLFLSDLQPSIMSSERLQLSRKKQKLERAVPAAADILPVMVTNLVYSHHVNEK